MKGSMRRRGSAWQLRVYAGHDTVSGRKRWVTRTVNGSKRDAERELAAMVLSAERGEAGTDATVGTLLKRWSPKRRRIGRPVPSSSTAT